MNIYTIKPLEWVTRGGDRGFVARPFTGAVYHVWPVRGGLKWLSITARSIFDDCESAKSDCESHWQERISKSLVLVDENNLDQ